MENKTTHCVLGTVSHGNRGATVDWFRLAPFNDFQTAGIVQVIPEPSVYGSMVGIRVNDEERCGP